VVHRSKSDIVHIQYQQTMYGGDPAIGFLPWALAARGLRPTIVTTLHDMDRPTRGPKPTRRLAFESLLYGSKRLTVSNESEFRGLSRRPGLARRVNIVSVGSNIAVHKLTGEQRSALRASVSTKPDASLAVYFGLIRPDKGLDVLIDAMADLKARDVCVELLVIGDTEDPTHRDQLMKRAEGLDERVHFLGHQDEVEVSRLLQACDLAVLPFQDGATANRTTINAALSHAPLLTTRGPGTPTRFTDGSVALIDAPPDGKNLSHAIEDLIKQPDKLAAMAKRGRQLADQDSHDAIARQIAGIYRD
jgi:glycosyltransferase involved in cell wall biosynthesis